MNAAGTVASGMSDDGAKPSDLLDDHRAVLPAGGDQVFQIQHSWGGRAVQHHGLAS